MVTFVPTFGGLLEGVIEQAALARAVDIIHTLRSVLLI
jgi:hypothetical protein